MPAITASASLSCGTALGDTNEVTSIRGMPVAASLFTTSISSPRRTRSGSIWNPSRVPTSQIVTRLGSFMEISSGTEGERAPDRAYHQLRRQVHAHLDDGLEPGAVLRDQVVHAHLAEGVHHRGDPLAGKPGEMEAADHRMDFRDASDARRVPADADDAAVRARGHDHETPVLDVGDQRLLADEGVLDDLAVPLDLEGGWDHLEGCRLVHLAAEQDAFGQERRLLDHADVEVVALELVAVQAADVHALLVSLVVARQEVVAAGVECQRLLHPASVGLEEAPEAAVVVHVAVGERDRVHLAGVQAQLEEVVGVALAGEP